jgi:hypothetical protein
MTICWLARRGPNGQFKDNERPMSDQFLRDGGMVVDLRRRNRGSNPLSTYYIDGI